MWCWHTGKSHVCGMHPVPGEVPLVHFGGFDHHTVASIWVQRVTVFSDSVCASTDHERTILVKTAAFCGPLLRPRPCEASECVVRSAQGDAASVPRHERRSDVVQMDSFPHCSDGVFAWSVLHLVWALVFPAAPLLHQWAPLQSGISQPGYFGFWLWFQT